jgi:hypothetical protein
MTVVVRTGPKILRYAIRSTGDRPPRHLPRATGAGDTKTRLLRRASGATVEAPGFNPANLAVEQTGL